MLQTTVFSSEALLLVLEFSYPSRPKTETKQKAIKERLAKTKYNILSIKKTMNLPLFGALRVERLLKDDYDLSQTLLSPIFRTYQT